MEASTAAFVVIGLTLPLIGGAAKFHRIHKFATTLQPADRRKDDDGELTPSSAGRPGVPETPAEPQRES